jgi:hypothetical protein
LVLVTFLLAAIGVYVYIDYNNLKNWVYGTQDEVVVEQAIPPVQIPRNTSAPKQIKPETKFKVGETVYVNASVGDQVGFESNDAPLWRTYDGSENEEYQDIKDYVPHRYEVKIERVEIGTGGKAWYKIITATGLPLSGWIEEKYLSRDLPERRHGRTNDWGA